MYQHIDKNTMLEVYKKYNTTRCKVNKYHTPIVYLYITIFFYKLIGNDILRYINTRHFREHDKKLNSDVKKYLKKLKKNDLAKYIKNNFLKDGIYWRV